MASVNDTGTEQQHAVTTLSSDLSSEGNTENSIDSSFKSVGSTSSNITSVTVSSDQFVHCKLYENITEAKSAFLEITNYLQKAVETKNTLLNKSSDSVVLLTGEQLDKALKTINKGPVMDMFKKLYNAVRPICLPSYTADNRPKASGRDIQLASVVEKVDRQLESTNDKFSAIQDQLTQLTKSISDFRDSPASKPMSESYSIIDSPGNSDLVSHNQAYINSSKSSHNFLDQQSCDRLHQVLDNETYYKENGREVAQYGAKYDYMGANAKVNTTIPPALSEIVKDINDSLTEGKYEVNSVLVNRYIGENSYLPEHADDEYGINPESDIFTISIGSSRPIVFKDSLSGAEHEHAPMSGSLYCMTRQSQGVYTHRIDKDSSFKGKTRYSITFRCVHYMYLNSTCILGDSNTAGFKFGESKGTFGRSTPGKRLTTMFIEDISPESCMAYKNVVLMVGTNNLKSKDIKNTADTRVLVNSYTQKIREIRQLNKRCQVFIVPVIPTRYVNINQKVWDFNKIATSELPRLFSKLSIVEGIGELADRSSGGTLGTRFRRNPDPSGLHINDIGISLVVKCIKTSIFKVKSRNQGKGGKVVSNMPYAAVTATGASPPVTQRQDHGS
jgi:hypothetical protein